VRYAFIERHRRVWPICVQCRVLRVSVSGYHQHRARRRRIAERRHLTDAALLAHISAVYAEYRGAYGWPRIWRELVQRGIRVGKQRVQRLMQQHGIRARGRRRFRVVTTDSGHGLPTAPNLLDRKFAAQTPNQVWSGDITYIATAEGWLFLAVVIDLFSRKVVGWSMRGDLHRSLVIDALQMAWYQRLPEKGALIFHSDRGSQYASEDFRQLLDQHGIRPSMSRRGNCWDNAVTETLFGSLKVERLHGEPFPTIRAAKDAVLDWLLWYNRRRMHSTLNYVSPAQYEQDWKQKQQGRGTDGLPESMEETMKPFLPPFPQTLEIACGDSHTSTATTTTGI
jgi:transposase InsO family protein